MELMSANSIAESTVKTTSAPSSKSDIFDVVEMFVRERRRKMLGGNQVWMGVWCGGEERYKCTMVRYFKHKEP